MNGKHWLWLGSVIGISYISQFIFPTLVGFIFLIGLFAWTYFTYNDIVKEKELRWEMLETRLKSFDDFTPTYFTKTDVGYVGCDDTRHTIKIVEEGREETFNFADVISSEVVTEPITFERKSKGSFLKRGIFGALLGGTLGMVVATSNTQRKSVTLSASMALKVTLNSLDKPVIYIVFLKSKKGVSKTTDYYQSAQKDLEYWKGVLDVIKTNQGTFVEKVSEEVTG